jgi:hypothetical protein
LIVLFITALSLSDKIMDFFKNCQTGVYCLDDFSIVPYWRISVDSSDVGRKIETYHRESNTLVHWNEKSLSLWIFKAPEGAKSLANVNVTVSDDLQVLEPSITRM